MPPDPASDVEVGPTPAASRRFGWWFAVLGLRRLLEGLRLDATSAEHVRRASVDGLVVYVMRRRSTLDQLGLDTVLNAWRLPASGWASGASTAFHQGRFGELWLRLVGRVLGRPPPDALPLLADAVRAGRAVTVSVEDDGEAALAVLAAHAARPIRFVPVAVLWNRAPKDDNPLRRVLRAAEPPGFLREFLRAWAGRSGGLVRIGEPITLASIAERFPTHPARAARSVLHRLLAREVAVVRGPELLPWGTMRHLVLDHPRNRALAREEAAASGRTEEEVRAEMGRHFRAIAADFRWWAIVLAARVLRPLWTRVFSGVDIRPADLDAIRSAMRRGSVVIVPCHKSHFDYVLLSWVFFEHNLMLPHIVAGDNLALWPLSALMRRSGAFFIRRRLGEDRVYAAVFTHYVRELVRAAVPIEFFIEGGRSRTGRLLRPRLGVLGMVLDAAELRRDPAHTEVTLLPMAFAYEEVAEEATYARELGGEKKEPETFLSLLRARSVLSRRFGRAYLRVGRPVSASYVVDAGSGTPIWSERPAEDRKATLRRVGERVVWRIGQALLVTAPGLVSLGLLAHGRRGIRHAELGQRCRRLLAWLQRSGAEPSGALAHFDAALRLSMDRLVASGVVDATGTADDRVWALRPERRLRLDFAKNQLLHYFSDAGLAAAALRGRPDGATVEELAADVAWLRGLMAAELVADPDETPADAVRRALDELAVHGAVRCLGGDDWAVSDRERAGEIWSLVRSLLEGLRLPLLFADRVAAAAGDTDRFAAAICAERPELLEQGVVTRPEAVVAGVVSRFAAAWTSSGVLPAGDIAAARARLDPMVL